MRTETISVLLVAACCLFAVVSMAATLENGVQGTPDEVVDVDMNTLPLPSDQAEELKNSVQGDNPRGSIKKEGQADPGTDGRLSNDGDPPDEGDPQQREPGNDGQSNLQSGGDGDRMGSAGGASNDGQSGGGGMGSIPGSEDLLSFLRWLLEKLLGLLGWLLALGIVGLLAYKRDLLFDRLRDVLGWSETTSGAHTGPAGREPRSPENTVERLWLKMHAVAGIPERPDATPRERAQAAVQAGLQRESVRELTALFEDVRYGDRPVTTSEVQAASTYLQDCVSTDDD